MTPHPQSRLSLLMLNENLRNEAYARKAVYSRMKKKLHRNECFDRWRVGSMEDQKPTPAPEPDFHWTTDNRVWYRTVYLKSDHWRDLRKAKLKANPLCEKCTKARATEPHHLRYRNIFDVLLSDLISVCRKCHVEIHKTEKMANRKKPGYYLSDDERTDLVRRNRDVMAKLDYEKWERSEAGIRKPIKPPRCDSEHGQVLNI